MDWNEFESEIDKLAKKITVAPDIIIGIVRGGVIPAVLLSKRLKVKEMLALKVRKEGDTRKVFGDIGADVSKKDILLVEDMLESGKSLVAAKEYLESRGAVIKTACLYTMPITETQPDYSLREVSEAVRFPWE